MRFSDSISNIATALAKVQAEIKNPLKTSENKGVQGNPKYATLEDTLAEYVRPVLSKHDMSFFQTVKSDETGKVGVATVLFHKSGEFIEGDYIFCDVVIPISNQGKKILTEGQATGVCITYLRRYSLNAALGITGDKDTDGSYGEIEEDNTPLTYEKALEFEITFGKHKNQTLKEVYKTDREYIDWLLKGEKTDPKIKEAIQLIEAEIVRMAEQKAAEKMKQAEEKTND